MLSDFSPGKSISFLGDSLSTYEGWNPAGYSVFYDDRINKYFGLTRAADTWWSRVLSYTGGKLCVNASYSGRKVSGNTAFAGCSDRSIQALECMGMKPDVIVIWLGTNDWGYGIPVHENERGFEQDYFAGAYCLMLRKIKVKYPGSLVICGTLMQTYLREDIVRIPGETEEKDLRLYNQAIREAASCCGAYLADVANAGIRYETLDGVHATVRGHKEIADAWVSCLLAM